MDIKRAVMMAEVAGGIKRERERERGREIEREREREISKIN